MQLLSHCELEAYNMSLNFNLPIDLSRLENDRLKLVPLEAREPTSRQKAKQAHIQLRRI